MRVASLSLILCCLLVAGHTAHAQRARCVGADGMGYPCSSTQAGQTLQSPGHVTHPLQPNPAFTDPAKREKYTGSNLSQHSSSGDSSLSSSNRQRRESMDSWLAPKHELGAWK